MVEPTVRDLVNATLYATRRLMRHRLEELEVVEISDVDWPSLPFHLPETLSGVRDFRSRYVNRADCESLSCFTFDGDLGRCRRAGEFFVRDVGYRYCQDACFANNKTTTPVGLETVWKKGKCLIANTAFKVWCLYPTSRSGKNRFARIPNVTDVPPFVWNHDAQTCSMTPEYCEHFQVAFDQGDCVVPRGMQSVSEWVFGTTLTRGAKKFFGDMIPAAATRSKRSAEKIDPYAIFREIWDADSLKDAESIELLLGRLARDFGLSYSSDAMARMLERILLRCAERLQRTFVSPFWKALVKNGGAMVRAMARAAVLRTVVSVVTGATLRAAVRAAAVGANVFAWGVAAVSLVGAFLDIADPEGYNNMFDSARLLAMADLMRDSYRDFFGRHLHDEGPDGFELTPEFYLLYGDQVRAVLSEDAEDGQEWDDTYLGYQNEYFRHLVTNSLGQRIDWSNDDAVQDSNDFVSRLTQLRLDTLRRYNGGRSFLRVASGVLAFTALYFMWTKWWIYAMTSLLLFVMILGYKRSGYSGI
jgi:hypothetical protein